MCLNNVRLFLVEDNADIRTVFALVLSSHGFDVVQFGDATSAREALEDLRPAAAIIDIELPDTNGFDLAREFRKSEVGRNMVLASLTGNGTAEYRNRSIESGFDLHFVKPAELKMVCQQIDAKLASAPRCSPSPSDQFAA